MLNALNTGLEQACQELSRRKQKFEKNPDKNTYDGRPITASEKLKLLEVLDQSVQICDRELSTQQDKYEVFQGLLLTDEWKES